MMENQKVDMLREYINPATAARAIKTERKCGIKKMGDVTAVRLANIDLQAR